MSRFKRLSHTIWHCQYHIIWVPKYRYRVLSGNVGDSMASGIEAICGYAGCEVNELNVQRDHMESFDQETKKVWVWRTDKDWPDNCFSKVSLDKFHKKKHIPTSNPRGMETLSNFGLSTKTWQELKIFK